MLSRSQILHRANCQSDGSSRSFVKRFMNVNQIVCQSRVRCPTFAPKRLNLGRKNIFLRACAPSVFNKLPRFTEV